MPCRATADLGGPRSLPLAWIKAPSRPTHPQSPHRRAPERHGTPATKTQWLTLKPEPITCTLHPPQLQAPPRAPGGCPQPARCPVSSHGMQSPPSSPQPLAHQAADAAEACRQWGRASERVIRRAWLWVQRRRASLKRYHLPLMPSLTGAMDVCLGWWDGRSSVKGGR